MVFAGSVLYVGGAPVIHKGRLKVVKTFEIFFDDLNEEAKERLTETFNTSIENENWDIVPIAVIEREIEEK